jgi:hypothetical protein
MLCSSMHLLITYQAGYRECSVSSRIRHVFKSWVSKIAPVTHGKSEHHTTSSCSPGRKPILHGIDHASVNVNLHCIMSWVQVCLEADKEPGHKEGIDLRRMFKCGWGKYRTVHVIAQTAGLKMISGLLSLFEVSNRMCAVLKRGLSGTDGTTEKFVRNRCRRSSLRHG